MFHTPGKIYLVGGIGESDYGLLSFDRALSAAGIADLNHIKVSSIVPANCEVINADKFPDGILTLGQLSPTVYSECRGRTGELLSCCIVCIQSDDPKESGVIFEHSGHFDGQQIRFLTEEMARTAMADRGKKIEKIQIISRTFVVREPYGCSLCAAVMV